MDNSIIGFFFFFFPDVVLVSNFKDLVGSHGLSSLAQLEKTRVGGG